MVHHTGHLVKRYSDLRGDGGGLVLSTQIWRKDRSFGTELEERGQLGAFKLAREVREWSGRWGSSDRDCGDQFEIGPLAPGDRSLVYGDGRRPGTLLRVM